LPNDTAVTYHSRRAIVSAGLERMEMRGDCRHDDVWKDPVDKVTCSYQVLWNNFKRIAAGYSADETTALFSGTAAEAYRLPL
jgi:predicted TIM-barrel fold metal-dependent hydrolase